MLGWNVVARKEYAIPDWIENFTALEQWKFLNKHVFTTYLGCEKISATKVSK